MTTSMSTELTGKTARSAPRYYRRRTPACAGQIVVSEVERLALEALSEPLAHWSHDVRTRLREYAAVWNALWPINRRRALLEVFAAMAWHRKPERLVVERVDVRSGPKYPPTVYDAVRTVRTRFARPRR